MAVALTFSARACRSSRVRTSRMWPGGAPGFARRATATLAACSGPCQHVASDAPPAGARAGPRLAWIAAYDDDSPVAQPWPGIVAQPRFIVTVHSEIRVANQDQAAPTSCSLLLLDEQLSAPPGFVERQLRTAAHVDGPARLEGHRVWRLDPARYLDLREGGREVLRRPANHDED